MRSLFRTTQFKRDTRRLQKRGCNINILKSCITDLINAHPLDAKYHDHPLVGGYKGTRECHLAPDWLLIYEANENELILIRTGSHADLFE
jgi:mRNA interferase YafQ